MIKHPTFSPEAIEDIQRWCFAEEYRRLGPGIFRVLGTRFLGYQTLRNSPNRRLRAKAGRFAADLRAVYPVFLAGGLFGPNASVRHWIGDLERRLHAEFGRPAADGKFKAALFVGLRCGPG